MVRNGRSLRMGIAATVAGLGVLMAGCSSGSGSDDNDRAGSTSTRDTVTVQAAPDPRETVEFALRYFYSRLSDPNPDSLLADSVCPTFGASWVDIVRDENIRVISSVTVDFDGAKADAYYDAIVYKFGRTTGRYRYTTTFIDDAGAWKWCGQQRDRTGS